MIFFVNNRALCSYHNKCFLQSIYVVALVVDAIINYSATYGVFLH